MPKINLELIKTLCDTGHKIQNCGEGLYRCLNCMFELRSIETFNEKDSIKEYEIGP